MISKNSGITAALQPEMDTALAEVVTLPPSAHKVDKEQVERAAQYIVDAQDKVNKAMSRVKEAIGTYLLDAFYLGDPQLFYRSSPSSHKSLSALIARCESLEISVSQTFLISAMRIAVVNKQIESGHSFRLLPPSHQDVLLAIRDPRQLEGLAAKALAQKMSVPKLREEVQKIRKKGGRGRTPTPPLLKAMEGYVRALKDKKGNPPKILKKDVHNLTESQRMKLKLALEFLQKTASDLQRALQ